MTARKREYVTGKYDLL